MIDTIEGSISGNILLFGLLGELNTSNNFLWVGSNGWILRGIVLVASNTLGFSFSIFSTFSLHFFLFPISVIFLKVTFHIYTLRSFFIGVDILALGLFPGTSCTAGGPWMSAGCPCLHWVQTDIKYEHYTASNCPITKSCNVHDSYCSQNIQVSTSLTMIVTSHAFLGSTSSATTVSQH